MKKYLILLPLLAFAAAACNNNSSPADSQPVPPSQTQNTPMPPAPSPTTAAPTTPPTGQKVSISTLTPARGPVGTKVTISGQGFTATGNHIAFGNSNGSHHPDGTADNVFATANSADGKTLTFTVPATGPSGILCNAQNHCVGISAMRRLPGPFNVSVSNQNGTSNILTFTVSQ